MEDSELQKILIRLTEKKEESSDSKILKWISGIIAGVIVVLVTTGFIWGVSGLNDNATRIAILESQTDLIKKQNEKVIDVVQNLSREFTKFSSADKYTVQQSEKDLESFYRDRVLPLKSEIEILKNLKNHSDNHIQSSRDQMSRIESMENLLNNIAKKVEKE